MLFIQSCGVACMVGFFVFLVWAVWRDRAGKGPAQVVLVIRYNLLLRVAVPLVNLLCLGFSVLFLFMPDRDLVPLWLFLFLCALYFVYAFFVWGVMRFRVVVRDDGIECRSFWQGGTYFIAWEEVDRVFFKAEQDRFVIRANGGYRFYLSITFPHMDRFLQECEKHLPFAALAPAIEGYAMVGRQFPNLLDVSLLDVSPAPGSRPI